MIVSACVVVVQACYYNVVRRSSTSVINTELPPPGHMQLYWTRYTLSQNVVLIFC